MSPAVRTLTAAGVAVLLARAAPASAQGPQVAVTFDDLPVHASLPPGVTRLEIARTVLADLKAAAAPPTYGFVNGDGLVKEPDSAAALDLWRAQGQPLGNHTWSHMNLAEATAATWTQDVLQNEPLLSRLMPQGGWRWLRFPYLSEGDTPAKRDAARSFLAAHGYRVAQVTLSFGDYAYNDTYARCVRAGSGAAVTRMEATWIATARSELQRAHAMSTTLYGRDIPYVLLLHEGAFTARMLPRLFALYRREGVRLVSLETAQSDPFYLRDDDPALPFQPDTLEGRLRERGLEPPPPADLSWLNTLCPTAVP